MENEWLEKVQKFIELKDAYKEKADDLDTLIAAFQSLPADELQNISNNTIVHILTKYGVIL